MAPTSTTPDSWKHRAPIVRRIVPSPQRSPARNHRKFNRVRVFACFLPLLSALAITPPALARMGIEISGVSVDQALRSGQQDCFGWSPPPQWVVACLVDDPRGEFLRVEGSRLELVLTQREGNPAPGDSVFFWETVNAAARAPEDFLYQSGYINVFEGEVDSEPFHIETIDDDLPEPDEAFAFSVQWISGPANVQGFDKVWHIMGLLDNDGFAPPDGAVSELRVLLFEHANHRTRQGFLRVINHSNRDGEVEITATDDFGFRTAPVTLSIDAGKVRHFNSWDLENGNPEKGLSGGVGPPTSGDWRLLISSALEIEVLAYSRNKPGTANAGFVNAVHDRVPVVDGEHRVLFFNPASNVSQVSLLRLTNTSDRNTEVTITGIDDLGTRLGSVSINLNASTSETYSAENLELGNGRGMVGALGSGRGKRRLAVTTRPEVPIAVNSLLANRQTGDLTNVSSAPHGWQVPYFPTSKDLEREGFVRLINPSDSTVQVSIQAISFDLSPENRNLTPPRHEPVTLEVPPGAATHFNSSDLELGDAEEKGLTGHIGPALVNVMRLEMSSNQDIEVLSYVRTNDGFLTAMHDTAIELGDRVYWVPFFNPASNERQVSRLRIINPSDSATQVSITGVDDDGLSPGSPVNVSVPGSASLELTSIELESGNSALIDSGALGNGAGKWRLKIASSEPVRIMSVLMNPSGHVTNTTSSLRID